jgi:hypothetical protein
MKSKKDEFITLKEAAEISGYAPDYIGQLIRQGKIEGKQVFSNVAWVTTEEALRSYMGGDSGKGKREHEEGFLGMSLEDAERMYALIGKVVLVIFGIFALFLIYVFSVSVDQKIEQSLIEKTEYGTP